MNKHFSDRHLLLYLEDDLTPEQRERVKAHLPACPTCRARLERLARSAMDLTTTLRTVGEQVPLAPARSWEALSLRRKGPRKGRGLKSLIPSFRPLLRHLTTLAVLALAVGGLAGLIHTLAVTGPVLTEPTPLPSPTPLSSPSPAPGPLPRPARGRPTSPVSILILGADGEGATSNETDALMLLYLDAETSRAFLLSIPRDLYVEVPGFGQARAGGVYGLDEQDRVDGGLTLAREAISATLGLPVQRAALVRFDGFVALINAIGGVDVEVPHTIEDPTFPDDRGGYDPLFISAGAHHFDGALALRYARTRVVPAPGFDRAFRQQQLILAVHERVTRFDLLPDLIAQAPALWSDIAGSLETDLSLSEAIDLALLAANLSADDFIIATLDECCTVPDTMPGGERGLVPQPDAIETLVGSLLDQVEER